MVKPLTFKGDKKPKKRKRDPDVPKTGGNAADGSEDSAAVTNKQLRKTPAAGADDDDADLADDTWVSAEAVTDLTGPVMLILPTEPPSALACDTAGTVFALPIENIVDSNPASAEPHDVRQVWVANRVSGTLRFRFKGHHGRFLGCWNSSSDSRLVAMAEAVSPLESFDVAPTPDTPGTFQLQTVHDTFVTVRPASNPAAKRAAADEVRCDAETIAFHTTLRVRMQARFKPRIKASREEKALAKISRRQLEEAAGRRLNEDEVRTLKRARREGDYHDKLLDIKVKGKHDKFA